MNILKGETSLFGLSDPELDAIGEDINLYFNNYRFFYAVDAYDLIHFFFPYLDRIRFTPEDMSLLAREAIAYDTFFSASDKRKGAILLLDEYEKELFAVRDIFLERVSRAQVLTENIHYLESEITQLEKDSRSLQALAYSNFDLFLLLLIFLQRKHEAKSTNFIEFMKKKVYIKTFDTGDEAFDIYADEAFDQGFNKAFVQHIYDLYRKKSERKIDKWSLENRQKFLFNVFRDITAIEKVLTANKVMEKNQQYNQTVFYYLSSTPQRSQELFDIIQKTFGSQLPLNHHFKAGNSVHRNIMQVFLFNILIEEYPDTPDAIHNTLDLIKNYKPEEQETAGKEAPKDASLNNLDRILNKITNHIENHFFSSLYKKYESTLKEAASSGSQFVNDFIKTVLEEFDKIQKENERKLDEPVYLQYNISKYNQVVRLREAVSGDDKQLSVRIRPGKDIIRLNYHHLPYLLFITNMNLWDRSIYFYWLMKGISDIVAPAKNYLEPIKAFLRKIFTQKQEYKIQTQAIEFLVGIYIDLLEIGPYEEQTLELDNKPPDDNTLELSLIRILEEQGTAFLLISQEEERQPPGQYSQEDSLYFFKDELFYLLIWLYRRNLDFDKILELETNILPAHSRDPRILHGFGLAYEAMFYQAGKTKEDLDLLHKSIHYLSGALKGYHLILEKTPSTYPTIRDLIIKSIIGIANSNCDSALRLFELEHDHEKLTTARNLLESIKYHLKEIGSKNVAIINHTEAEVEYFEALHLLDKKEIIMATKKIGYASRRFRKSVKDPSFMSPDSKGIGEKIEALRIRLMELSRNGLVK